MITWKIYCVDSQLARAVRVGLISLKVMERYKGSQEFLIWLHFISKQSCYANLITIPLTYSQITVGSIRKIHSQGQKQISTLYILKLITLK